jgi:uncharacterized protein (DUF1697 family)
MTSYVALLRAVNVGGRQLKMDELKRIAVELDLHSVRTFIASGNLLFHSGESPATLKRVLERAIERHMGKRVEVMLRSAEEIAKVVADNPFEGEPDNRVVAIFLEDASPAHAIASAKNIADERLAPGSREIYVHFPSGQGRSKLKFDARSIGTARNMNTTAKLAELAREKK